MAKGGVAGTPERRCFLQRIPEGGASRLATSAVAATTRAPAPHWLRDGVTDESYGFDVFGNLVQYNGRTLPVLGTTNRLAAAGYDGSGNMTAWNDFSFTWDALDRMTALAGNGLARRFAATADGERVVEREGSTYTFSLRGLDNRVLREMKAAWTGAGWAWDWEKDSIWGAGRLLASVSRRDGIRHAHVDHLTSPRLLTNRCSQRVALLDHNPWGLDRPTGVQDGERHRFAAHQRDLGLLDRTWDDLDYLHARYYNPNIARFLSPDPVRGNPTTPQSWNLYTYVQNNPVNATDPDGELAIFDFLKDLLTGKLFEDWFRKKVDQQTKPETQQTEQEKQEQQQLLQEARLPASNQGAILGTGGARVAESARENIKEFGGPIVREVGAAVVTVGLAKGVGALSQVKNISGKDLVKQLQRAGATVRESRGSHVVIELGGRTTRVPLHGNQSLGKGLLNKIFKDLVLK